jgi:endoribonuclease Dicer
MRNAKLALTTKKTDQYAMRTKPSIWARNQGTIPACLFATLISLVPSTPLSRDHGSIVVLTRERLPSMPPFPVFLEHDIETAVSLTGTDSFLDVAPVELDLLTVFTLSVFHDLFHKTYTREPERLPYWLAPAREKVQATDSLSILEVIDWQALKFANDNQNLVWSQDMKPESLLNRLIYDNWNGKYRYFPLSIDQTLSPLDPPPSYVPVRKWSKDIMNWTLSLSKNSRPKFFDRCIWDQPVLQAEMVCLRRNFLDKASEDERAVNTKAVICPQALCISAVSHLHYKDTFFVLLTLTTCNRFHCLWPRLALYSPQSLAESSPA